MKINIRKTAIAMLAFVLASAPLCLTRMSASATDDGLTNIVIRRQITRTNQALSNMSFGYELSESEDNPGKVSNLPTNINLRFLATNAPVDNVLASSVSFSMNDVSYPMVGDYKFTLKEVSSSNNFYVGVDSGTEYSFVVNVRNRYNEMGQLTGTFEAKRQPMFLDKNGEKVTEMLFKSGVKRSNFTISNVLKGNMANLNQYFKFRVVVGEKAYNEEYRVTGQDEKIIYNGEEITTTNVVKSGEETFLYLKHGQYVTVGYNGGLGSIPALAEYEIKQMDGEDYETDINRVSAPSKSTGVKVLKALPEALDDESFEDFRESNTNYFVNWKNVEEAVPTGVNIGIASMALFVAMATTGILALRRFVRA